MKYKVDYNPSFDRDPKEIIGAYREELLKKQLENIDPADAQYKTEVTEKPAPSPDKIGNMEDFTRSLNDLSGKLDAVNERSNALNDALTFDPLAISGSLQNNMNTLGIEPSDQFTVSAANCAIYVLNYHSDVAANAPITESVDKLEELNKKLFPEWGIKFILILFYMFLKGITWQILTTLCRALRSIKLKIGPYKPCIGCPFAKPLKRLVQALNKGKDYKIDNKGNPILDSNGRIQKWGSCPPDFDPYGYDTANDITNAFRGNDLNGSTPQSICQSGDIPSPNEVTAAKDLLSGVLLATTANPTDNNVKISQYITNKTNASNYKKTISNLLKNTAIVNDPKGTVFTFDPVSSTSSAITKVSGDVQKAISDYSPQKLIDSSTKGMLQLVNGMLKVWDGMTSAIAKTAGTPPVNKDMICCFLNLIGILFPTTNIDESIDTKKVVATLSIMKKLIDFQLAAISTQYELEYFTLDELSNALQDAILYNVYTILSPVVNSLFEDMKNNIDPNALLEKYKKKLEDEGNSATSTANGTLEIIKAIQNCVLFDVFVKQLSLKIESLQVSIKTWFIGFKGQNDIKTRKLASQIQLGSQMKLMFSLSTILGGVIDSLNKGVKAIISICNQDGNVTPADIQTIEQQLDSALYSSQPFEIPPPVYDPNTLVGIDNNDPVDTIFVTGEFYDATYSNMAGYGTNLNPYGTIESSARDSLEGDTDNNPSAEDSIDRNIRDCTDSGYLTQLRNEVSALNDLDTLFDV